MTPLDGIIGPVTALLDQIIPDPKARDAAKLRLLQLSAGQPMAAADTPLAAETHSPDRWTSRARPSFLYVMYALLLWAIPMGLIAAVRPQMARDIAAGMNAYLAGIPEPLYALFGTGYLGYTVARQWGKVAGTDR
jgi:hypothetical protein